MSIEHIIKRHLGIKDVKKRDDKISEPLVSKDLVDAINEFLLRRNKKEFRKFDAFHPSYTSVCVRWWYLMFKGMEFARPFDARTHRVFDHGNDMHERFCTYFKNMGILVDTECPFSIDYPVPIRGRADAIIDWPPDSGELRVVELKSISPEGFMMRKYYKKPKDDHLQQINVYMKGIGIHKGFIIYEDKGTQSLLAFDVEFDEDIYRKKLKVWERAYKYITDDRLPSRPYKRDSDHCKYCDIAEICWNMPE